MIYIGIDPGKSGAVAFLTDKGDAWTVKLNEDLDVISDAVEEVALGLYESDGVFAVLEKVHSSPQMGVKSAFSFGQSFGHCEALLACHGIPYQLVRPQQWQKDMDCMTKGDKNVTKKLAQSLFPELKVTHATADALLLASYARRIRKG